MKSEKDKDKDKEELVLKSKNLGSNESISFQAK